MTNRYDIYPDKEAGNECYNDSFGSKNYEELKLSVPKISIDKTT